MSLNWDTYFKNLFLETNQSKNQKENHNCKVNLVTRLGLFPQEHNTGKFNGNPVVVNKIIVSQS